MLAKYILAALAAIFLVAAAASYVSAGRRWQASARTWLLVAAIFGAISAWLHYGAPAP
jgi:uncharacterized membrane protein HdeD (DUF308 family)